MVRIQPRQRADIKCTGGEATLPTNPEKGRAGKRKTKQFSLSEQRDDQWLKMHKCMAPDRPKLGL